MPLRFRCYIDPEAHDVIKEWYDASDEAIQGAFLGIIENLQRKSSPARNENIFKRHASNCLGLHEILIDHDARHYRIIGVLEENIFTMLWPFYKNICSRYTIPCREANKRRMEISLDRRRAKDCEFPLDED
jgi:hypothetical protein